MTTEKRIPTRFRELLKQELAGWQRDALITTDVGWNKNGVGQQFPILEAGTIFTPGGYATMGFGAPAALGAKIARPDRAQARRTKFLRLSATLSPRVVGFASITLLPPPTVLPNSQGEEAIPV